MKAEVQSASNEPKLFNVPNQLTAVRFVLSIVVFILIGLQKYIPALVVFSVAAATDWVDGYWARRYGQVTKLGRIFDPFVDKIIICGTFVFLTAEMPRSGIAPWVTVVVVGRELLVTALRSLIEGSGGDFSAKWVAKWKMGFQCLAAGASLVALAKGGVATTPDWINWVLLASVWLTLLTTIYSGIEYLFIAWRVIVRDQQSE